MKMYTKFKEQVVNRIVIKHGLSVGQWEELLCKYGEIKSLYDEKVLFPFVGIVKE